MIIFSRFDLLYYWHVVARYVAHYVAVATVGGLAKRHRHGISLSAERTANYRYRGRLISYTLFPSAPLA